MSSVSVRIFFITDDNAMLKVPNAKFERMLKGSQEENTTRFAGKRIRAAEIAVMIEDRKPVMVLRAIYFYLHFNEKGILDSDRFLKDGHVIAEAGIPGIFMEKTNDNVINAQQEFAKRKRDHTIWWKPNMKLERDILDASIGDFKCKRL
jgi:hypothetical protein